MTDIMPGSPGDTNPTARDRILAKVTFHSDRYEADFLAELDAYRAEVLAEAIEAARGEYLTDDTGTDDDAAYNQAVSDVLTALGRLTEGRHPTAASTRFPCAPDPDEAAAERRARRSVDAQFPAVAALLAEPAGSDAWPPNGGHEGLCGYASGITADCTCKGAGR